jgi:hypothetical protein
MTTITIERASLEKIIEKFAACGCEVCTRQSIEALKAALAAPATAPEQKSCQCLEPCMSCFEREKKPATAPAQPEIVDLLAEMIDIINGRPGPWLHLYAPFNKECNGCDPVDMLGIGSDYNAKEFEPYTGSLPDSDEYKAEQAAFDGCLSSNAEVKGDQT